MSRDKQIEEMAKDLYGYSIDTEEDSAYVAKILIDKGYFKASKVAREIFEEIDNILNFLKKHNPCDYMLQTVIDKIAELKKKCTQEK